MTSRLLAVFVVPVYLVIAADASSHDAIAHPDTRRIAASEDAMLRAICSGPVQQVTGAHGKTTFGCRTCPDGTTYSEGFSQKPIWGAHAITTGHFLSRNSTDAIVAMGGCAGHSENFGGSVLLTKRSDKWTKLWYEGGLITDRCKLLPRADRPDILLCEDTWEGMGEQDQSLYTVHPTESEGKRTTVVFSVSDTLNTCSDGLKAIQRIGIEQAELQGTGAQPTLRISVRHGSRKNLTRAEFRKYCATPDAHVPSPPTRLDELQFILDGEHFVPAPASRELVKALSPEQ